MVDSHIDSDAETTVSGSKRSSLQSETGTTSSVSSTSEGGYEAAKSCDPDSVTQGDNRDKYVAHENAIDENGEPECYNGWIDAIYLNSHLTIEINGKLWNIITPLCAERVEWYDDICVARVIYQIYQGDLDGEPDENKLAVMKAYMQIGGEPCETPDWMHQEIDALKHIQQAKSKYNEIIPAPGLVDSQIVQQDVAAYVEGGFTTLIVMDFMPGLRMSTEVFDKLNDDFKNVLRFSFKKSLQKLWDIGVAPTDRSIGNLVWHEEKQICYIVDFQNAHVAKKSFSDPFVNGRAFFLWGLAETSRLRGWKKVEEQFDMTQGLTALKIGA